MNILYINDFAPTFTGSFFESLYALSVRQKKDNHKLFFIFPLKRDYISLLDKLGVVYYCPSFIGKKFDLKLTKLVFGICKREKINIIHTNFGLAGFLSANFLTLIVRNKHVSHQRSLSSNLNSGRLVTLKKIRAKLVFRFLHFLGSTSYIAISTGVKESLQNDIGIKSKEITIIPNAVPSKISNINTDKGHLDKIKKLTKNKPYLIGMTAHFGPHKDHKTLVDAAEMVVNKNATVMFLLLGGNLITDQTNFQERISNYVAGKNLKNHFCFIGEVQDPMPYIELFDVGCLISHWEGFGNALVEYMLKKKPVIGTSVGGIKDIIEDGINGYLVPPQNAALLAEKIIYLLQNPQIAKNMGEQGYRKAIKEYDMDIWVNRIIKLYESVV